MSRRKIPSKQALIEALREADGNMASVARKFNCHRSLVWQYVDGDPKLRELTEELTETFIDIAESELFKQIREGNTAAIIFFLKTKARHRGYSERLELIPLNRQDIEVELGRPTNEIEDHNAPALNGNGAAVALLEQ
jgi:hypothetical protein